MGRERRPTVGMGVGVHEHVPESICQSTILQTAHAGGADDASRPEKRRLHPIQSPNKSVAICQGARLV